jgi:hypothetical protein
MAGYVYIMIIAHGHGVYMDFNNFKEKLNILNANAPGHQPIVAN